MQIVSIPSNTSYSNLNTLTGYAVGNALILTNNTSQPLFLVQSASTPTEADVYVDYDRAKTSGATAQQVSVSGGADTTRYLAAGTYYLELTSVTGTSVGRFAIAWEERPNS